MSRYEKPVWQVINEIMNELPPVFSPRHVVEKVKERYPNVLESTIRAHVIALTPNHPSSKHYSLARKMFYYLGDGRFRALKMEEFGMMRVDRPATGIRQRILDRMNKRVEQLCTSFAQYIEMFDRLQRFSGPSWYFHFRTLDRLRQHKVFSEVFDDDLFFEYLYATLTSWGLHRMGPGGAKLIDFTTFVESLRSSKGQIESLYEKNLLDLSDEEGIAVADRLCNIFNNIKVSTSKAKLVANSKTLHHLLPHLMPPMDREYTLQFFYNRKMFGSDLDEEVFREIYPWFIKIARYNMVKIQKTIGRGFHTSETKVIDNAIVGFVLTELKRSTLS